MSNGQPKSKPDFKPGAGLSASDLRARLGLKTTPGPDRAGASDLRARLGLEPGKPADSGKGQSTHALSLDEFEDMVVNEREESESAPHGLFSGISSQEEAAFESALGGPADEADLLSSSILIEDLAAQAPAASPSAMPAALKAPPPQAPSLPAVPSPLPTAASPLSASPAAPAPEAPPPEPVEEEEDTEGKTSLLDTSALSDDGEDFDAFPDGEKTQIMMSAIDYDPLTARLIVESGEAPQKEYILARDKTGVGRGTKNGIVIPDIAMSRNHMVFERYTEGFLLRDLDSGNGTTLNGRRIVFGELRKGDIIEAGNLRFRFEQSGGDPEKIWKGEPKVEYHAKDQGPVKGTPSSSRPAPSPSVQVNPALSNATNPAQPLAPPQPQTLLQQPMAAQWSQPNMMPGPYGMQPGWAPGMMPPAYASYTQQGLQAMMAQQQQRRKGSPVITALIVFFSILLIGLVGLILWSLVERKEATNPADAQRAAEEQRLAQAKEFVVAGSTHFEQREWAEALRAFEEALRLDPNNPTALLFIQEVIPAEQAVDDRLKDVRVKLSSDPSIANYDAALDAMNGVPSESIFHDEIRSQHLPTLKKNFRRLLIREARKAIVSGNFPSAIVSLDKVENALGFSNDPEVVDLRKQIADKKAALPTPPK
ncbi:MAG: FHA domain-containing protein [Myxococcota bacterium]|nr:FHA domain-containing protein [Myxococcota bacterium]